MIKLPDGRPAYTTFGIVIVEMIVHKHTRRQPIGRVEFVRYVPAERTKLSTFLNDGVKEGNGIDQGYV